MAANYFRFNFKGKEGSASNSFITLKHDRPEYGEVTVGLSHKEDDGLRGQALEDLYNLSKALDKKVRRYSWNYHDAVLVETDGFDTGLGVLFATRLEKDGMVPKGSTEKFKVGLKSEGHEIQEKELSAFMELAGDDLSAVAQKMKEHEKKLKEKKRLFRLFNKRKRGVSK